MHDIKLKESANPHRLSGSLAIVRHGETEWNRKGLLQGRMDLPLNAAGYAQAQDAATRIARRKWDVIVTSPLSRAVVTATVIASAAQLSGPHVVPSLVEQSFGAAEGQDRGLAATKWPDGIFPGGESIADVRLRVREFLKYIESRHARQHVIVVCHVVVFRLLATELGLNDPGFVANGSVLVVDGAARGRVSRQESILKRT